MRCSSAATALKFQSLWPSYVRRSSYGGLVSVNGMHSSGRLAIPCRQSQPTIWFSGNRIFIIEPLLNDGHDLCQCGDGVFGFSMLDLCPCNFAEVVLSDLRQSLGNLFEFVGQRWRRLR